MNEFPSPSNDDDKIHSIVITFLGDTDIESIGFKNLYSCLKDIFPKKQLDDALKPILTKRAGPTAKKITIVFQNNN